MRSATSSRKNNLPRCESIGGFPHVTAFPSPSHHGMMGPHGLEPSFSTVLPTPLISRKTVREKVSAEDLRGSLPRDLPFLWLDSRFEGEHHLLLGRCWELSRFPDHWSFKVNGEEREFAFQPSMAEAIDTIHADWLPSQFEGLELGFLISYEAGWEWEERRHPRPLERELPLWTIFCPEEMLVLESSGRLTHRHGEVSRFDFSLPESPQDVEFAKGLKIRGLQNQEEHMEKICSLKEHIRKGDSFQVNLSQTLEGRGKVNALDWARYAIPREGGAFSALWQDSTYQVMSLSPERLLRIEGKRLITRPIAGTLPRHRNEKPQDLQSFVAHPKELAEHNMLIDLERNDLGKVSEPGSVEITEKLTIETLPHVHHLVSQVEGVLKETSGYGEALEAVFPGGTITGCPKLETMHLLDTYEEGPRGPYTGSLGYLSRDTLDSNILIRSALVKEDHVSMRFGGGIVWDSEPEKEYLETIAKSRGIVQSLLEGGAIIDPDHRSLRQFFS